MSSLFLQILELSLCGSILILAALPIRLLMRKAPKWTVCLLWLMVAIALVCPIRLESPVSLMPSGELLHDTVTAPAPTMPLVQTTPILIQEFHQQQAAPPSPPSALTIAAAVWLLGMAAVLGAAMVSYLRLKRQVAVSAVMENNVYLCDHIDTPFILGILRPRIYLPSHLDEVTARQVLIHEGAHLKRRDHWWKPLGYLLLTVHWFNPLVWLAYGLLCRDIELACDERVIKDMDTPCKKAYSEALLTCSMHRHLITSCPLAFGEVSVKQRIKAVLHYRRPAFWVTLTALLLCIALALGFLTKPTVTTLQELGVLGTQVPQSIQINGGDEAGSYDPALCAQALPQLELQPKLRSSPVAFDLYITLPPTDSGREYFLWFNEDCSLLYLGFNAPGTEHTQLGSFKVLNPHLLTDCLVRDQEENLAHTDSASRKEAILVAIEEHFWNKNKNVANLTMVGNVFQGTGTEYAVISLDYLARDGSVLAENCLLLAQLRPMDATPKDYYLVDGLASGERGMSAGYYPNLADLNGQTVLWTTRSATHLKLIDGAVDASSTVPNRYDTYRITYQSGTEDLWTVPNETGVFPLPAGEQPVRIAPVDESGREVSALAFDLSNAEPPKVQTILSQSGHQVFLEMDPNTGEILALHSEPVHDPIFPKGFNDHKALCQALYGCAALSHWDLDSMELLGQQTYGAYEYAVIRHDDEVVLMEYTLSGDTAMLLGYAPGDVPDTAGLLTGYRMNCSAMEGGTMYWSLYAPRYKVTPNGKDVAEPPEAVNPAFSAFRFTMRDLKTHDFPADDSFFLCAFSSVIPPAIVTPMEQGRLLAALGSEPAGGLTGTIILNK